MEIKDAAAVMAKKAVVRLTLTVEGYTRHDIEVGLQEAAKQVAEGILGGNNCNDDGAYWFDIEDRTTEKELAW